VIVICAVDIFVWLGLQARVPDLGMNLAWTAVLAVVLVLTAGVGTIGLWRATRFS